MVKYDAITDIFEGVSQLLRADVVKQFHSFQLYE